MGLPVRCGSSFGAVFSLRNGSLVDEALLRRLQANAAAAPIATKNKVVSTPAMTPTSALPSRSIKVGGATCSSSRSVCFVVGGLSPSSSIGRPSSMYTFSTVGKRVNTGEDGGSTGDCVFVGERVGFHDGNSVG